MNYKLITFSTHTSEVPFRMIFFIYSTTHISPKLLNILHITKITSFLMVLLKTLKHKDFVKLALKTLKLLGVLLKTDSFATLKSSIKKPKKNKEFQYTSFILVDYYVFFVNR